MLFIFGKGNILQSFFDGPSFSPKFSRHKSLSSSNSKFSYKTFISYQLPISDFWDVKGACFFKGSPKTYKINFKYYSYFDLFEVLIPIKLHLE